MGALIAAFAVVTLAVLPAAALEGKAVVLQGLDKVTARVSRLEAPIGATIRFGNLVIVPRAGERTPQEEPPESTVYLDITEVRPGEAPVDLFHGWMFASSPALAAMEHPVYDVWVVDCSSPLKTPSSESAETSR